MPISRIKRITKLNQPVSSRYDIETEDVHNFFANGILVHNSNCSITYVKRDSKFYVNQREYTIVPKEEGPRHMFWDTMDKMGIFSFVRTYVSPFNMESFTIYGEFLGPGIHDNIYGLKQHHVMFYDVKADGKFFGCNEKMQVLEDLTAFVRGFVTAAGEMVYIDPLVPDLTETFDHQLGQVTLREWLNGKTIQEASNGKSQLKPDILREGIVITPIEEQWHHRIGRLILKQRSPLYLKEKE